MVAKVRRVANPNRSRSASRPKRKARATAKRAVKRNGPKRKKKLSAKQIKFFGTKRQRSALKSKRKRTHKPVTKKANPVRKKRRAAGAKRNASHTSRKPVVVIVRAKSRRKATRKPKRRNPIQALTLGFVNPHRKGSSMAKRKRRAKSRTMGTRVRRRARNSASGRRRRRATRSVTTIRRNSRRRGVSRRNPAFFGSSVSTTEMVKYIAGGLIGVAATKAIVPMLPDSLRGSQAMAVASSLAVAVAVGWAASKLDPKIGSAVLFGGLMQASSVFLNSFVPPVGRFIGLSGGRGVGEFVPARFPVPQNPILAGPGAGIAAGPARAYMPAY